MQSEKRIRMVSVQDLYPNPQQPRKHFDESALRMLAASIRESGLLQPICVREKQRHHYEIIAGERRFRASVMAGLQQVPCLLLEADETEVGMLALLENLQRSDLNYFEVAEAVEALLATGQYTQAELAAKLGKAPCTLANKLRLLQFTETERQKICEGGLTERHARALLAVEKDRAQAIDEIVQKGLNVAETEKWILARQKEKDKSRKKKEIVLVKDVRVFLNTLRRAVDVMNRAGISASCQTHQTAEQIEYTVQIPLSVARKRSKEMM